MYLDDTLQGHTDHEITIRGRASIRQVLENLETSAIKALNEEKPKYACDAWRSMVEPSVWPPKGVGYVGLESAGIL